MRNILGRKRSRHRYQTFTRNLNAQPTNKPRVTVQGRSGRGCTGRGFGREVRWSTSGKLADIQGEKATAAARMDGAWFDVQ